MKELSAYNFDGRAILDYILVRSEYGGLAQTVASLSLFTHPDTVAQSRNRGIFNTIRCQDNKLRGSYKTLDSGQKVMLDDNTSPTQAFLWANGLKQKAVRDVQFNHVWSRPSDPNAYTSLANIVMLPAFLSKLSDTHSEISRLLKFHVFKLYGYMPDNENPFDLPPPGYETLKWSQHLMSIDNLKANLQAAMSTKPRNRTTMSVQNIGWIFSET